MCRQIFDKSTDEQYNVYRNTVLTIKISHHRELLSDVKKFMFMAL